MRLQAVAGEEDLQEKKACDGLLMGVTPGPDGDTLGCLLTVFHSSCVCLPYYVRPAHS